MEESTKRTLARVAGIALCGVSIAYYITRIVQLMLNEREKTTEENLFDE